jgi:hypothetical protein
MLVVLLPCPGKNVRFVPRERRYHEPVFRKRYVPAELGDAIEDEGQEGSPDAQGKRELPPVGDVVIHAALLTTGTLSIVAPIIRFLAERAAEFAYYNLDLHFSGYFWSRA